MLKTAPTGNGNYLLYEKTIGKRELIGSAIKHGTRYQFREDYRISVDDLSIPQTERIIGFLKQINEVKP